MKTQHTSDAAISQAAQLLEQDWQAAVNLMAAAQDLYWAARCALADLEGIMPEFEPSGDREHPAWQTIKELKAAIKKATQP
jgi:2-iminoacetate synthase ThiH